MSSPDAVISLSDVTKVYRIESQEVHALRGVSAQIHQGQMVAVTGRSGSGKSTLLYVAGTLDRATSGRVVLNGTDVSSMPDQVASHFRNCTVGFVFQMNNLIAELSALENVMLPGMIGNLPRGEIRDRASNLLKAVGLSAREKHRPGELSGGEQQRVAIARALLMAPPLLLADEPTGNLDKRSSQAIQELLFELCRSHQMTMLLVTHDLNLAAKLPQQLVMEDGRIVEFGGKW